MISKEFTYIYVLLITNDQRGKMSLNKALENLKFDKRLMELNLKLGRVTLEEIEQNTQNLPDLEAQCEKLDIEKEDKDIN